MVEKVSIIDQDRCPLFELIEQSKSIGGRTSVFTGRITQLEAAQGSERDRLEAMCPANLPSPVALLHSDQ